MDKRKEQGMIKFKDLQNKVYSGKQCIRFEYTIRLDNENKSHAIARFERQLTKPTEWKMQIIFDRTRDKDSEVYNFGYIMPRDGLPLELIAATGLKYFQLYIKEEVQAKSNLDFELGNILQDM